MSRKIIIALVISVGILLLLVAWVLSASRIGPLESCLADCSRYIPEETYKFSVLNLNILHGYPEFEYLSDRLEIIATQIIQTEPDLVTLQEVPWTWNRRSAAKYLAEKTGMNYVYLPANGNRWAILFSEGEAILSRYPLKNVEFKELKPRAGFFEHRVALKVTAVLPWGEIQIISTHLTNGDPEINEEQTHDLFQIISELSETPVIVAGDFNARENSPQIKFLSAYWIDTYRQSNPLDPGLTCCLDILTGPVIDNKLEKRIDFLFLIPGMDSNLQVMESKQIFNNPYPIENCLLWASDHVGIISYFELISRNSLTGTK